MSRTAILQTAFIGDVALTGALAQALKDRAPAEELHFVTTPQAAALAECFAAVDRVHVFDKRGEQRGIGGLRRFSAELRSLRFTTMVVPHRSVRSTLLARMSGAERTVGFDSAALSFMYHVRAAYRLHLHEVERNHSLFKVLYPSDINDPPSVKLNIPPQAQESVDNLLAEIGLRAADRLVAIAPGSVWATKRWPRESFAEIIMRLSAVDVQPLLVGGPDDVELCAWLSAQTGAQSLAGRTTLPEMLALLTRCRRMLTNDSAPTHLANLAGCPAAVLFGPTIPEFGFAPRGQHDRILQAGPMACRPCSIHGPRRCPLGTHACMHEISVQSVLQTLTDMRQAAHPQQPAPGKST